MKIINICNKIIEYSLYALFSLVPLAFTSATSELFELNKMWLTWGLTIIIGMAWFTKMILQRRIYIQRTPLDIPIALFLLSQIISTIFSQDTHVSLWGYYSRFNGGLLSIISYIFLYYAFVSNFVSRERHESESEKHEKNVCEFREKIRDFSETHATSMVKKLFSISLLSGLVVAFWGLPSHFGYDPTCLLFRGTFDVSCWTADFMPRVRIFSTLGQPDWLAAYLAILLPLSITMFIKHLTSQSTPDKKYRVNLILATLYLILTTLYYLDLLYTSARSGFLAVWISLIFFFLAYLWMRGKSRKSGGRAILILFFGLLTITFIIGTPMNQLHKFTLDGIRSYSQKPAITETQKRTETQKDIKSPESGGLARNASQSVAGGTESADIRLFVWTGAINAWKNNPLFGTGVETFAFAYYKYKPAGQNLTSEWNFLYNKAHNEYLNYLATTGAFGLGTYLLMIGTFLFLSFKYLNSKFEYRNSKQYQNSNYKNSKRFDHLEFEHSNLFRASDFGFRILSLALLAGYISILITNFFGFSVVITNIYLFMIPAFVFALAGMIKTETNDKQQEIRVPALSPVLLTGIFFVLATSCFLLIVLFRFWQADIAYALGYNLDRAGKYQEGYKNLHKAVELRGDEPVFKDEFSINNAIIAAGLLAQSGDQNQNTKDQTIAVASSLAQEAINASNEIISKSPNNAVFWKTRTKVFYTLSQIDSRYLPRAVEAIEKASVLGPNDANISYNLGVLYGQNNNIKKGIQALEKTIKLKPDYRDAYYALGLYYRAASLDAAGKVVVNETLNQKAIAQMQYILDHLSPNDASAIDSIKTWKQ